MTQHRSSKKLYHFPWLKNGLAILILLFSGALQAAYIDLEEEIDQDFKVIETENFLVYFLDKQRDAANRAVYYAEEELPKLIEWFSWSPKKKIHFLIADEVDAANGWATPIPFNEFSVYLSPPDTLNTLEDYDSWLRLVIQHELTHIVHLDKAEETPDQLRSFFGRLFLLFPNALQPAWLVEGLAVHKETDLDKGVGRGQSSLYRMSMRTAVAEDTVLALNQVNTPWRSWPLDKHYLYGAYFYKYVEEVYGDKAIQALVDDYSQNLVPFQLNSAAVSAFGKAFPELWADFEGWLKASFSEEIDALRQQGVVTTEAITQHGLDSSYMQLTNEGLYYIHRDGINPITMERISAEGLRESLGRVRANGDFDVHPKGGIVISQPGLETAVCLYNDLFKLENGRLKRLTECQRYRRVRWLPDGQSLLAQQVVNGIVELDLLDADGEFKETLWKGSPGEVLGDFDLSPDGKHVIAARKLYGESWDLARFVLADKQWEKITDTSAIEAEPSFTDNGNSVLFSADYDGVFNVYKMDLTSYSLAQLTRTVGGMFKPLQSDMNSPLYVNSYSSTGYDVSRVISPMDTRQTSSKDQAVNKAVSSIPDTSRYSSLPERDYSAWPSILPTAWMPFVNWTGDGVLLGGTVGGQDAAGLHAYGLTLLASNIGDRNELYGNLAYSYGGVINLLVSRSPELELNGTDVERLVASEEVILSLDHLLTNFDGTFSTHLGGVYSRDIERYRIARLRPRATIEKARAGVAFTYNNAEAFLYSVAPVTGRSLYFSAESHDAIDNIFQEEIYTAGWTEYFALPANHALNVSVNLAYSEDLAEPVRLGGYKASRFLFGRDEFDLRGYRDNSVIGREVWQSTVSWEMPLGMYERTWGIYPLGLQEVIGRAFVDVGGTKRNLVASREDTTYVGAGFEATVITNLGFAFNLPLTMGYAHGFDDELGDDRFYLYTNFTF